MASFQEEKNIWEFLSLEESQLEGGKIKAYRDMNCMEEMKGEWPLLCWGEDEIGRREMTLTSTSTSVESPASCTSFTSVPNSVSCLWVMLAKNASSHKETVGEQRNYITETWKRTFKQLHMKMRITFTKDIALNALRLLGYISFSSNILILQ